MSISDISKIPTGADADRLRGRELAPRVVIDVPMSSQRSLATVTAEIRTLQDASRRVVLGYSVEIGRRLVEAKDMVERGDWGRYLREELGFSQSTANNHMRIFEAYGADQMSLTGAEVNNQAFADLDYTKALALLALPSEEEREAFVAAHDMATISTRQLQEELRRRTGASSPDTADAAPSSAPSGTSPQEEGLGGQIARATAEDRSAPRQPLEQIEADRELRMELIRANSRAKDAEAERDRILRETEESREKLDAAKAERDAARQASAEAERKAQAAAEDLTKAQKALKAALDAKRKAEQELKEAKADKSVPAETLEQMRKEAEEAARKALEAEGGASLEEAREKYAQAEKEASEARRAKEAADQQCSSLQREKEALEKQLRLAAPELAEFKVIFSQAQEALNRCVDAALNLPPDRVEKGINAVQRLLEIISERISKERWEAFPE